MMTGAICLPVGPADRVTVSLTMPSDKWEHAKSAYFYATFAFARRTMRRYPWEKSL